MKKREFEIRLEDAFIPMPPEISDEIESAFERGEQAMKKRYKIMSLLSVAAVVSVFFAVAAMAVNEINVPKPDKVVLSAGENKQQMEPVPTSALHSETEALEEHEQEMKDYSSASFYYGDFSDPEALYMLLSNAYWSHAHENNLEMDSRAVFAAAGELKIIFSSNNDGDVSRMCTPILECLQSVLGFDADFIAQHYLINDVLSCLYGSVERLQEEAVVLKPEEVETAVFERREEVNSSSD